jgi:DNA-binding SARP family transcriptional activator
MVVNVTSSHASLSPEVDVDVRTVTSSMRLLLSQPDDAAIPDWIEDQPLDGDLLPDWYDDWVLLERERLRQLRLHALESLAGRAIRLGRYGHAIDTALTAIQADPLRESAHRVLIRAYLAEGNAGAAMGQYHDYCARADRALGLQPSSQLRAIVSGLV